MNLVNSFACISVQAEMLLSGLEINRTIYSFQTKFEQIMYEYITPEYLDNLQEIKFSYSNQINSTCR